MRVSAFVDGFNLYHAIDDLGAHHLKWVNLRKLCEIFAPPPVYDLEEVLYFSAFATWRPQSYRRHREYVKALEASGVTAVMGRFPKKEFRIIGPVGRGFSMDLVSVAGGKKCGKRMKEVHLDECLLPSEIRSDAGQLVATRPAKYHPPTP